MAEPIKTPIEPGLIARVAAGVRYAVTGKVPDWFGPQDPLPAAAPPEVAGRQLDYPTGYNLHSRPRQEEAISFAQMRALADGYDLMRLVIESRKDQLAKLAWTIKSRESANAPAAPGKAPDGRCQQLIAFFQSPDKEHDWHTWLRMLLEDLLVIDAATLYPRRTRGGELFALEPMDGATIKRVLDQHGRTPLPPQPAYQQILKGLPAVDYTREQLIYLPRNPRTHKVYGYSPVEQVIVSVNIALRRQAHQLSFYTEGSTPDLIFQVPETWQAEQIRQFEDWWNSVLSGDSAERRKTRFVPKGVEPFNTKAAALKDEMDEWLARIVCYAFSVSPQPFIKEMNRATAQTGQEAALAEGLAPLQQWVKSLLDQILAQHCGQPGLEFVWQEEEAVKPLEQAQIDKSYVEAKVLHPDEVRDRRFGLPPMTAEQKADLQPPPALPGGDNPDAKGKDGKPVPGKRGSAPPGEATNKRDEPLKKALRPIPRERAAVIRARTVLTSIIEQCHRQLANRLAATARGDELGKEEGGPARHGQRFEDIISDAYRTLLGKRVRKQLQALARDGVVAGFGQLQLATDALPDGVLAQASDEAVAYATQRAAELVGMRQVGGQWVDNPDARWRIDSTTRRAVNALVTQATQEGWSGDTLANALQAAPAFGEARAAMIARTECAFADAEGNLAAYRASGLVSRLQWQTASGCCPDCAALDGEQIALGQTFAHGRGTAPAHPNCRCDVLPLLLDEEDTLGKGYNPRQPRDARGRFAGSGNTPFTARQQRDFAAWAEAVSTRGYKARHEFRQVGRLPARVMNDARVQALAPNGKKIRISDKQIQHALRDAKNKRQAALQVADIRNLPNLLHKADWYYDSQHQNLVAAMSLREGDTGKAVVVIGFKRNQQRYNAIITMGIVQPNNLWGAHMKAIEKPKADR